MVLLTNDDENTDISGEKICGMGHVEYLVRRYKGRERKSDGIAQIKEQITIHL